MSKSIIITGANGFIGHELVKYFSSLGWSVKAFVHSVPSVKRDDIEYVVYDLRAMPDPEYFKDTDYLVHAAFVRYDRDRSSDKINTEGTEKLLVRCRASGTKFLYLSSFSAHPSAESHYGLTKLRCEHLLDVSKDIILRPGLVIGKKGLCGEIISRVRSSSFFPLVAGDKPVQTISVDDLCKVVEVSLTNDHRGLFHVAHPGVIRLKEFYAEIARQMDRRIRFIPLSLPLLYFSCRLTEATGIRLPVSSENVLGLKHLISFDTTKDLRALNVSVKDYKESLKLIIK